MNLSLRDEFENEIQTIIGLDLREVFHSREYNVLIFFFGRTANDGLDSGFAISPRGTWHILYQGKSIIEYQGGYNLDDSLLDKLKLIENQRVKQVYFWREKLHLFLEFDNGYWLGLFHYIKEQGYYIFPPMESVTTSFPYTIANNQVIRSLFMT